MRADGGKKFLEGDRMSVQFKRKESDIKKGIVQYLRSRGCLVIPYRSVGIMKKNGRYIPMHGTGVSDLLGLTKEGQFFAIEVKTDIGRPTYEQIQFLETVKSFKCIAIIARSIDDCIKVGL